MKGENVTGKAGLGKKISLIVLCAIVACAAIFTVLWVLKDNMGSSVDGPQKTVAASDEETLRELLLKEENLLIQVDEEIEVEKGFVVNGIKELTGEGELRMALSAEWKQALLNVSEGATLTMNGLTLNGNYVADGIHTELDSSLTYLDGTIKLTDVYSIWVKDTAVIEDINIDRADYIGVYAERGSNVEIKGGTWTDVATDDLYIDETATVAINGDVLFQGCMGNSVLNYGTVTVNGGTYKDITNYGFNNYGTLTITSAECTNASLGVVCNRTGATADISGLHVYDTVKQAVVAVGGNVTIKDSKFERTGSHSIDVRTGKTTIENVTVIDSQNAGIEAYTNAEVELKNFTVEGCKGIGIASRGAKITGSDIKISESGKYGISCGNSTNGKGNVEVSNVVVSKPTRSAFYAYSDGVMKLTDATASEGKYAGIYVAKGAECTLLGNSIIEKMGQRGVEVRGRFHMKGGEIRNCVSKESGAGVYVTNEGVFAMTGGSIHDNAGGEKKRGGGVCVTEKGIATIDGGKVYNNKGYYGGGLYVNANGTVYLKSGSITGNKAVEYGNGICISSKEATVKLSEPFYLAKNDVKLAHKEAILQLTGSGLSKHSSNEPLLITPIDTATEGHKVAACKNATTAKSMNVKVASGDGSYYFTTNDRYLTTGYTTADMDLTGADTVYVSNFAELKAAVKGAASKRIIVLKANIAVEEQLRLPGGSTVKITDDGTKRTLTRADGYLGNLVKTNYGTGLYLTATTPGNLILDGNIANPENKEVKSLVEVRGSTKLEGVVLQNNVSTSEKDVRGALVRQWYGDIEIYDSTLRNAKSYSGGAVCIDKGKAYVEGSTFVNNESIKFAGGAIRMGTDTELKVVGSIFERNKAASAGGAIVAVSGADVVITDSSFANNTSVTTGGALSMNSGSNATVKNTSFVKNVANSDGGAIYVDKGSEVKTSGATFTENKATKNDKGTVKYGNGGAVHCKGTFIDESSSFKGNVARNGGAIAVMSDDAKTNPSKGKVVLKGTINATFKDNVATGNTNSRGGAIFVHSNKCSLEVTGYTFDNNTAANGGAIGGAAGSVVKITDSALKNNKTVAFDAKSTDNKGGAAIYAKGKLDVANTMFEDNQTDFSGGAIYADNESAVTLKNNTTFKTNVGKSNGGAIFVASEAEVESETSVFDGNSTDTTKTGGANGGAVLTWGTFKDTDSTYKENTGRNGGAIGVMGGTTTLAGTNAAALFEKNNTPLAGGAVYISASGTVEMTGYTFNENTTKEGGAFYVLGKLNATGTKFTKNKTTGQGGAVYVKEANANAIFEECAFDSNTGAGGAAICVQTKGTAETKKCTLKNNTSIDKSNAYQNGGAVLNYGIYTDEASTFTGNIAKNGGAIITQSGGTATLDGKGTGKFSGNESKADALSYAIYANGTVTVEGYKFEGETTQTIRAVGTLDFDNIADTKIIQGANGKINVVGIKNADKVTITPYKYEIGFGVLNKTDDVTPEEFESVCAAVQVIQKGDGTVWVIDKNGKLQQRDVVRMHVEGVVDQNFKTFEDAITELSKAEYTSPITLYLLEDVTIGSKLTIAKEITIVNETGKDVAIQRGTALSDIMFEISAGGSLTLGTSDKDETGTLTVDGMNISTGKRIVDNKGTFTLEKNAAIKNVKGTTWGAVIINRGPATLRGTITDNTITYASAGGAVLNHTGGTMTIEGGTYTNNVVNGTKGGFLYVYAGTVSISEGTFTGNSVAHSESTVLGGAVAYVKSGCTVLVAGGTHSNNAPNDFYVESGATLKKAEADAATTAGAGTVTTPVILVKANGVNTCYETFAKAITAANTNNGTIYLYEDITLSAAQTIKGNVTITNAPGKTVIMKYGMASGTLITVNSGATLTLGTDNSSETGKIIVDGDSKTGRLVDNKGTFHLMKNGVLQNVTYSWGGALVNRSTATLNGTIQNVTSTNNGGCSAVLNNAGNLTINGGLYTNNSGSKTSAKGGFLNVQSGTVTINGGTFSNNSATAQGGAIFIAAGTTVTLNGGTFTGNTSATGADIYVLGTLYRDTVTGTFEGTGTITNIPTN